MEWMNMEQFCTFIRELADCNWFAPPTRHFMKPSTFADQSYKHWAIQELAEYCIFEAMSRPVGSPSDILQDFADMMDEAACRCISEDGRQAFSTAYDVAMFVLDLLMGGSK